MVTKCQTLTGFNPKPLFAIDAELIGHAGKNVVVILSINYLFNIVTA